MPVRQHPLASFLIPESYTQQNIERNTLIMQQTKKLYDDNPYQTSFDASVLSCEPYTAPEKKAEQGTPL